MDKIDYRKEEKHIYAPSAKDVVVVDVPVMNFLMIDGAGDPNTTGSFREAVEALFGVSYTLKFMIKKARALDYGVLPLEGLWWCDDMSGFRSDRKDAWKWTVMIRQPEPVTAGEVAEATARVRRKKPTEALAGMRFETWQEGPAAQILHVGPFADEGPVILRLHAFIHDRGHTLSGRHHEIYLSNPGKTAPEKLKTVIRQPFRGGSR